jgi:DNA-binding SARP family transcriptional activator
VTARRAGVAPVLALAALIAGIPAALYLAGGSPVPHAVPSWHQVAAVLMRRDDGTLFLAAVRYISWLAWAAFTICAVVEAVSRARGRAAPRLPVIAPVQGLAAALVGAAVLGLMPAPHLLRAAPPPPPRPGPAAATAPLRPGPPAGQAPAPAPPRPPAAPPRALTAAAAVTHGPAGRAGAVAAACTHVVVRGDDLWDIARADLGDPLRWPEIFGLNRGRPQPDGRRLTDPDRIYPGWILLLPGGATCHHPGRDGAAGHPPGHRASPRPPAPRAPRRTQPGRPGPHHGAVPGGHAQARPEGGAAHRRARPPGIDLPGGGLVAITLAAAISGALVAWRLHRRRAAAPRWPIPAGRPEPPVPDVISRLRRAHLRSLAADAAEARGEPWPGDEDPGPAGPGDAEDGEGLDEFGAPASRASRQPASPDPGDARRLTVPGPGRRGSGPEADGAAAGALPAPVPAPAPAPPPSAGPGRRAGDRPAGQASGQPAPPARPLPAGTVVFGTRGNTEIPLAAVARPGVGLTGPGARAAARALMIGLLAAPAAGSGHQRAQVVIPAADALQLAGDHQPAAPVPGVTPGLPGGLTVTPSLASALDHIETEITRRLRLQQAGQDNPAAPATPGPGEAALPPLALIATVGRASAPRIRAVLEAGARAGVTGVLLGGWPAGTTCHIGADGEVIAATGPGLAGVRACHLPAADTAALLSLLRGAQGHLAGGDPGAADPVSALAAGDRGREPARAPQQGQDSAGEDSPAQPSHHDLARPASPPPPPVASPPAGGPPAGHRATTLSTATRPGSGQPVAICVLGPLRITAGGAEIRGGLRKARELLAYLAIFPEGVTAGAIGEALWPESSPRYAASQRHLALRKAREILRSATGLPTPMFITLAGERYRLDPALIEVDLWQFDAALDQAQAAASDQDQLAALQHAAALYHGPLADGGGYDWAERYAEPARRRAVDALARIAGILQPGRPEQALTVLETALAHDPYNEAVYQKIMHIQHCLGRPDAARRTLRLLETRLAALGLSPAPATRQAATGAARDQPGRPPGARPS